MKIKYDKNNRYGEPVPKDTAWKILVGILTLLAVALVLNHFGVKI